MNHTTKITQHRHGRGLRFEVTDDNGAGVCCGSIGEGFVRFDKGSAPTKAVARKLRAAAGLPVPEEKAEAPKAETPKPALSKKPPTKAARPARKRIADEADES